MPTIAFASSKGGAGKTTSAVLLATELSRRSTVTLIDADPNKPVARWSRGEDLRNLTVLADMTEDTIIDRIEQAAQKTSFVIVDLEGTASTVVSFAIGRSDLVIIPCQGSQLDAIEAAKTVRLVKNNSKATRRTIPAAILFTRTSAAIRPRSLQAVEAEFKTAGVRVLSTEINERDAYRAIFSFGGTLSDLDPNQVRNADAAVLNARAFAGEVIGLLNELAKVPAGEQAKVA